ncbi:MAG: ABC transporter ATP-binding protein [Candidatus Lokiarchaeota archaeon]|nr:ABC transporter ATP-binding protein [Candidatus Lokiarchaeota archaeon]
MKNSEVNSTEQHYVEFSPGKDPFEKARRKGSRSWILKHIIYRSNKFFVITVLFTTILSTNLTSLNLVFLGNAINDFMLGKSSTLLYYTLIILSLGIGASLIRIINFVLREIIAQRMERDCRREFFSNLLGKSQSFHEQQQIGELMARVTDDVRMLNFLISPAISLIFESFTALVIPIFYIVFFFPIQLILAPIIFAILFLISLRGYVRKIAPITGRLRAFFGMMNSTLNETLTGIEVVKATVKEARELEKYTSKAKGYRDAFIEQAKVQSKYLPFLLLALTATIGLTHGIILNFLDLLSIGQIIGYLGLLRQLRFPTMISAFIFATVRVAISSSQRLLEMMNRDTEIDENVAGIKKVLEGSIKFENVEFSYPNSEKPVLKNISFEIKPGQTVAIVGTTGSGKTTLTKLISRLYDVNKGKLLIDNIDIKDYALQSLRSQISYIEQDVFLFSDSLFNNISFGETSSMEEVIQVTKEAQAHEFISQLPDQYDSEVGERGVQLSGGERQRIAIARAFLSDPQILILDDSTSAIDSNTEDKIQRAIQNILSNRTTLLITHRLSQIRWADLIIVLKKGEIAAMGTHEELLRSSPEYQKIFIKKFDVDIDQMIKNKEGS